MKKIREGIWTDGKIDLIYSPDDNGYYFQGSKGTSIIYPNKDKAITAYYLGIEWEAIK